MVLQKVRFLRGCVYIGLLEKNKESDFIVNNSLDFKRLEKEVDLLWKKIKQNQKVSQ